MVSVPADARIRHGETTLQLSQILVGSRVHVRGVKSGTMVTAQEVRSTRQRRRGRRRKRERGRGDRHHRRQDRRLPGLTFSIGSTMFVTDAATLFREACSGLADGDRVEVKGARQANGTVMASRVHVED